MPPNERIINRLERLYSKYGVGDKVSAMVSVGEHAYRTDIRRSIFEFFNRTLKLDARPVEDADSGLGENGKPTRIPAADLRAFAKDSDLPADQLNTTIDEHFVTLAKPELPAPEGFAAWRSDLVGRLKSLCFPAAMTLDRSLARTSFWDPRQVDSALPWLVVLGPSDEWPSDTPAWAKAVLGNVPVVLFQPRTGWTRKNPPNMVERAHALLGATVDSARVLEIADRVRTMEVPCGIIARRETGILAAYAALLEAKVERVVVIDPPASHREGPHFLSVLRVCDIPEALGCLAPRPLKIIGGPQGAFVRTEELYRRAGALDKLERK